MSLIGQIALGFARITAELKSHRISIESLAPKDDATFTGVTYSSGGFRLGMLTKNANYTILPEDPTLIHVDATSGAKSITLPANAADGTLFLIRKTDVSANVVNVLGTVDGIVDPTLIYQSDYLLLSATGVTSTFNRVSAPRGPITYAGTTDLGTVLSNIRARTSTTTYTLNTSGNCTFSGNVNVGTTRSTSHFSAPISSVSANTTLTTTGQELVSVDATAAARVITLPTTTTTGYRFFIKKSDASVNTVTIIGTVDGVVNPVLSMQNEWLHVATTATSGIFTKLGGNQPSLSGYGFPYTVDLMQTRNPATDASTVSSANVCHYLRVKGAGVISKIALEVTVSAGNISLSTFSNTGVGRSARPNVRTATTGAIACPAVGYQEVALGSSVFVNEGDWIAISSDSGTAKFRTNLTGASNSNWGNGLQHAQGTAHPAPATAAPTTGTQGYSFLLVGVT